MQPMIVKEIKQVDKVLERFEPVVLNPKICSDETLAKVKAMMEGVVTEGTARGIRSEDFSIAGKTGTAWKFKNGAYTRTYSTSFCGYFPADKPKYSCIVVVDSPKKGRIYGADVAAPVFREVADKAMARDAASQRPVLARTPTNRAKTPVVQAGMQDELRLVFEQIGVRNEAAAPDEDWVRIPAAADSGIDVLALQPLAVRPGQVPDVQGLTLRDALFLLENRGLRVRTLGTGRVKKQSVEAGSVVRRGTVVTLEMEPIGMRTTAPPVPLAAPAPSQLAENKLLTPMDTDVAAKTRELAAKAKARMAANNGAVAIAQPKKVETKKEVSKPKPASTSTKPTSQPRKPAIKKAAPKPAKPAPQLTQQVISKPRKA
jgi:cell division protein FtsI (penicillin-binding protein 3)